MGHSTKPSRTKPAAAERSSPAAHREDRERGVALVLGLMFGVIATGIVVSGTLVLRAHRAKTETSFRLHSQATQFARAGLIEALAWFRKQTAQPVLTFDPRLDTTATPPVLDTDDPVIGLVREFEISGSIWGRYEVWKEWPGDPDPTRLAWRQRVQVEDQSVPRGAAGPGNVWLVRSCAYVFQRLEPGKPYNQSPNRVLGSSIVETEIRRLTLTPPGMAALCNSNAAVTTIDSSVNIQGQGGAAIFHPSGTGTVTVTGGPTLQGGISPGTYDGSLQAVFGVSRDELRSLADDRITDQADFPATVPSRSLLYVSVPRLDFTPARPLRGNAIVYVDGDIDFQVGSRSFFTGFLYVDGDLTMRETLEFNGALVCNGTVTVRGVSDWINITYDDGALNALRTEIGQYRLSGAIRDLLGED